MNDWPTDPKKLRTRLLRYERQLRAEKSRFGGYNDGSGLRYQVGPLYLLLGDLKGATKSYAWFKRNFPEDSGEPGNDLCWALLLYRNGKPKDAAHKLRKVMLGNLYLLPRLLGIPRERLEMWHFSNANEPEYLEWIPPAYWDLWDAEALTWARGLYESVEFQRIESRHLEIYKELQELRPGPRRTALVYEAHALAK